MKLTVERGWAARELERSSHECPNPHCPFRTAFDTSSLDYDRRMKAARERAAWELGDSLWAGKIVVAFLYPEEDAASLAREKEL